MEDFTIESMMDFPADLASTFFLAAERRDYRALKECLRAGIDPNIFRNSFTVLHIASMNGDPILLEYMIKLRTIDINIRTLDFKQTPLHLATRNQQIKVMEKLLTYGADVEALAKDEKRPIHLAVLSCNIALIKVLIKYHPQLNVIDTFSHTPLSIAVLDRPDFSVVECLCKAGATPSLQRPNSLPLLYEAILNVTSPHYLKLIKLLVKHGSDVNEVDANGRNAFHYTAIVGSEALAQFFSEKKCSHNVTDKTGREPMHYAVMHGNRDIAQFISKKYGVKIPTNTVELRS